MLSLLSSSLPHSYITNFCGVGSNTYSKPYSNRI
jgi:hypothetical protein